MKRILILTDGWRRTATYAWTCGVMKYIRENNKDMAVYQFHSWGNWNKDTKYSDGEYCILDLPELDDFDAILVDVTNMESAAIRDRILEKVRTSGVPAVSVCYETPGLVYMGVDGFRVIADMVDHLCREHRCQTFHFAGGPVDQFENRMRRQAFECSMKNHAIPKGCYAITNDDYSVESGRRAAKTYFAVAAEKKEVRFDNKAFKQLAGRINSAGAMNNDGNFMKIPSEIQEREKPLRPLPDAFVCANDNIAVGVILELEKHGYHCPEDVRVTGMDNMDKAMYFQPQITTASLDREHIGYEAARVLDELMQNEDAGKEMIRIPHEIFVRAEPVFTESCGCPSLLETDSRAYMKWKIIDDNAVQEEAAKISDIAASLSRAQTLDDFMDSVLDAYSLKDCDGIYVLTDERLESSSLIADSNLPQGRIERQRLFLRAFREKANSEIGGWLPKGKSAWGDIEEGASEESLVSYLELHDERCNFFFMPLHIENLAVGYIALRNPHFIIGEWQFYSLQETILSYLRSWYSGKQLSESLRELSRIYDRDQLTGVYARTARKKMNRTFRYWLENGKCVAVFFADADRFKEINDNYGHAYGDRVLVQIAEAMDGHFPDSGFTVRYGGDEFVSACVVKNEAEAMLIRDTIAADLRDRKVNASIGVVVTDGTSEAATFDDYIKEADEAMYKIKSRHHEATRQ